MFWIDTQLIAEIAKFFIENPNKIPGNDAEDVPETNMKGRD